MTKILKSVQHKVDLLLLLIYDSQLKLKERFLSRVIPFILLLLSFTFAVHWPQISFAEIQFEDVTEAVGLFHWGDSYGASWGDFNSDGWPDLWVSNHCAVPALYRNNSDGSFTNVTELVKDYDGFEQHGAAWADFDNDGDQDLIQIVGAALGINNNPNQFFINSGGLLRNRAVDYGLDYPLGRGRTPLWFDWNADGYLDVFVTNLTQFDGVTAPSVLFTQEVDYFKKDDGSAVGTNLNSQFAQLFIPSLFAEPAVVIQEFPFPKRDSFPGGIYQYDQLPFHDISKTIGFPVLNDVYDVSIADFNNDMRTDFFLVTSPVHINDRVRDRLVIQTADGFQDITATAGLDQLTSCRSVVAADFDNDMDIDLYLVCTGCNIHNILYENNGNGTFKAVSLAGGARGSSFGKRDTATTVDYDNDGFIDLFVTNRLAGGEKGHYQLFRNVGNINHWLEIQLEGVISNRDGIGSFLIATTNGISQVRVQDAGIHRISQNHQRIHFGLANNTLIDKLTIYWPSKIIQKVFNIEANQIISVVELDFAGSLTSGAQSLTVDFTSNTGGHYKANSYAWDFNNDGTIDSTGQNPSYIYSSPGIYTVKLILTDMNGSIYTAVRKDYINIISTH